MCHVSCDGAKVAMHHNQFDCGVNIIGLSIHSRSTTRISNNPHPGLSSNDNDFISSIAGGNQCQSQPHLVLNPELQPSIRTLSTHTLSITSTSRRQRKHFICNSKSQTYTERLIKLGSIDISCRHAGTTRSTATTMAAMHARKVFEWIAAKKHDCY